MIKRLATLCGLVTAGAGCSAPPGGTPPDGGSGTAVELPLISPPVRSATPPGLRAAMARRTGSALTDTLAVSELQERFFSGSGPTDLMRLLAGVDDRIAEVNAGDHRSACLDQAPVSYTITPFGQEIAMVAQCYRKLSASAPGDVAFFQFGVQDGKTSLYVAIGAARLAAIVSPIAGTTDPHVDIWYGIGYLNATGCGSTGTFDDCSYGVTELSADPASHAFEMAVAGIGVGFCGVQFGSDGTNLYGVGSGDMGATCRDRATLCVRADDLSPTLCDAPHYNLPALGRHAGAGAHVFGETDYPDAPNITLDGTMTDSLYFGPLEPTPGTGDFDDKSSGMSPGDKPDKPDKG